MTVDQLKAVWGPKSTLSNWSQIPASSRHSTPGSGCSGRARRRARSTTSPRRSTARRASRARTTTTSARTTTRPSAASPATRAAWATPASRTTRRTRTRSRRSRSTAARAASRRPSRPRRTGYAPLSRPLFIYPSAKALKKPEVDAFLKYYLDNVNKAAESIGFVPLTDEQLTESKTNLRRFSSGRPSRLRKTTVEATRMGNGAGATARLQAPSRRVGEKVMKAPGALRLPLGGDDDGDRHRAVRPDDRLLQDGADRRLPVRHRLDPDVQPAELRRARVVVGTLSVTFWGMLFAIPIGLGAAIYLSEYAHPRVRNHQADPRDPRRDPDRRDRFLRHQLDPPRADPADLPGVVRRGQHPVHGTRRGTRGGSDDRPDRGVDLGGCDAAVPGGLREGAYAIGATKDEVATRVVFPAALSGIVASIVLASREPPARP